MKLLCIIIVLLIMFLINYDKKEHFNHWKYIPIHYVNIKKRGFYRLDNIPILIY